MRLLIDGYNLLHAGRSVLSTHPDSLQRERGELIDQLSRYRRLKWCDITVVFDGWQAGWATEEKERVRGVDIIFSRLGEKADEVMKRLLREKGAGTVVVTSDREISGYAERMGAAVVPSEVFKARMEGATSAAPKDFRSPPEEERDLKKKKGPSRRLSKKERRALAALKKL